MKKLFKTLTILTVCAVIAISAVMGTLFLAFSNVTLDESLLPVAAARPVFYDADGREMNYAGVSALTPEEIPDKLKNAFIALEDKRFYSHRGYDLRRIAGAAIKNIKARKTVEGASTITQQLIKNTHLTSEKTVKRKINEVSLARQLEKKYSKDQILSMYLSAIYFGGGIYGVKDAAAYYFGKKLENLSAAECATLAGIVKNPSAYSPKNNMEKSLMRRDLVLKLMRDQNMLSGDEYDAAQSEKMVLNNKTEADNGEQSYLKQCVREVLAALDMTRHQLENSGLKIYTHYVPKAQQMLAREIKNKSAYKEDNVEGAAVLVDNKTCGIIACYSTIPYAFRRQPGSVIKPLVAYAPALERGLITAASPVKDEKADFSGYSPKNYKDIYYGWTTPREAIKKSMNSVAVKTLSYAGSAAGLETGRKFGLKLKDEDDTLALALGGLTDGVTLTEVAGAYAALANGGVHTAPTCVKFIASPDGAVKFKSGEPVRAVSPETAAILTDVLVDTVKSGTARTLSTLPFQVAAKTGTVGGKNPDKPNTDAWCMSYTTRHTLAVWHGAADTAETGGGHPAMCAKNIWKNLYESAVKTAGGDNLIGSTTQLGKSINTAASYPPDFSLPQTVVSLNVDNYALEHEQRLLLAGQNTPKKHIKTEIFSLYNQPREVSEIFSSITVDNLYVQVLDNYFLSPKGFPDLNINDADEFFDDDFLDFWGDENKISDDDFDFGNYKKRFGGNKTADALFSKISISFDAKEIFCYKIERIVNGKSSLIATVKDFSGTYELTDTPALFSGYVTYKVTPVLDCDGKEIEGIAASELMFIKNNSF